MNRTIKAILAVVFVLVIMFSAISITQNIGTGLKADVTEQKIYSLSQGTKDILAKLNQPLKIKLYYAKTATIKGSDQIKFYNNYYEFVKSLLNEYVAHSNGMVELDVIDPRPYSEEEAEALRFGMKKFPITEEENFFFGLVVQTQFGVEKTIPFFSPDRQSFVEYDISYLIDTAITRQKSRVGVLSSLPVMGDEVSGYMAQMMRMQGQQPTPSWGIVEQLKQQYDLVKVEADTESIEGVDMLLVIHPKELPEKTIFAIDQYIVKGGRAVICVDPYCFVDAPDKMQILYGDVPSQASNLDRLFEKWGLEMPANTFAGDRMLAIKTPLGPKQRISKLIGYVGLDQPACFNAEMPMTADLNTVRVLFAGVLRQAAQEDSSLELTPLMQTTARGNGFVVANPKELLNPNPDALMRSFVDGTEPVTMGYMVTGKFKSAFPDGIDVKVESPAAQTQQGEQAEKKAEIKHLDAIAEATQDCAVAVFSDVDFISDMLAFQQTFLGLTLVGDNSTVIVNAIEQLSGSTELISIRSRGNYRRGFDVVDEIEAQAEAETAEEEERINAEIEGFKQELRDIATSAANGESSELIGSSIIEKKQELELKLREAQKRLQDVKLKRREKKEKLGMKLRNINMLLAPTAILIFAIALGLYRSLRKRHYISQTTEG